MVPMTAVDRMIIVSPGKCYSMEARKSRVGFAKSSFSLAINGKRFNVSPWQVWSDNEERVPGVDRGDSDVRLWLTVQRGYTCG